MTTEVTIMRSERKRKRNAYAAASRALLAAIKALDDVDETGSVSMLMSMNDRCIGKFQETLRQTA